MLRATRSYIEAIATALSDKENITFNESNSWQTNVDKKQIDYNPLDLLNLPALAAKGLILHETAHVKYTDSIERSPLAKDNESMQDIYNVLEDIRIEHKLESNYGDYARESLEETAIVSSERHRQTMKQGKFSEHTRLNQFLLSILAKNYSQRYYRNSSLAMTRNDMYYRSNVAPEVIKKLEILENNIIVTALNAKNTQELVDYSDNVLYSKLKEFIEEANKKQDEKPVHRNEKVPPTMGSLTGSGRHTSKIPSDEDLELLLSPYINTLAKRLQDVLKERSSTRYTGTYKHGRLLSKNAYKVLTDDTRIFSKKKNPNIPHYVVSFLLDESSSMTGERHIHTYIGSYLIKRACEKLNFPMQLLKFESRPEMIPDLSSYRTHFNGGGNNEERALTMIRENTDPKDDNLILVLTDGGVGNDPRPIIKKMQRENYDIVAIAVGLGRKNGETAELQRNYPDTVVAQEVEQLPRMMIELLRKIIHR